MRFTHKHTHTHLYIPSHTLSLRPRRPAPLFPRHLAVLLGCCTESLGGPHCSPVLMHLLSLFSYSGNERRELHTGESDGLEAEKARERQRERERERRGSLLLRAQLKPSRGSRLDNLSETPRLFSRAARLLTAKATAVTSTRISKPRDKGFTLTLAPLTLLIYPACLWLLPPCSSTPPTTGFQSFSLTFNLFKSSFPTILSIV